MRWQAPPRWAFLSWLLVLGAVAPLAVVEADTGGCNHIEGVEGTWSQCTDARQTLTYRALGLKLEEERSINGKPAEGAAWTSWWLERAGPLSLAMGLTGATALASAAAFPLLRRRTRPATAWWTMVLSLSAFLLAALAHAGLNGAERGWPSWGLALAVAALASGLALRRPETAPDGPMPSLPTFG